RDEGGDGRRIPGRLLRDDDRIPAQAGNPRQGVERFAQMRQDHAEHDHIKLSDCIGDVVDVAVTGARL
ncbi:hypothetical protein D6U55_19475, partial [Vibrio cholerae]|nr:hypothetical protein [Vibrio cholerae]